MRAFEPNSQVKDAKMLQARDRCSRQRLNTCERETTGCFFQETLGHFSAVSGNKTKRYFLTT